MVHIKGITVGREGFTCQRPYNLVRTWHSQRLSFRRPSDNKEAGPLYMAIRNISLFLVCALTPAYFNPSQLINLNTVLFSRGSSLNLVS